MSKYITLGILPSPIVKESWRLQEDLHFHDQFFANLVNLYKNNLFEFFYSQK